MKTVEIETRTPNDDFHEEYQYVLKVANIGYNELRPYCTTYSYLSKDQLKELYEQISKHLNFTS